MPSAAELSSESTFFQGLPTALKAGQFTVDFYPETGWLRYIRIGDHELARAIYPTLRGTNWETIPFQVRVLKEEIEENGFTISLQGTSTNPGLPLKWTASLTGTANSEIVYDLQWISEEDFRVNRIGLCVLHPASECVARACKITLMEGKEVPAQFPGSIKADPIFDRPFQKISYEVGPAVRGEIAFEGGPFETEDQRNWGDASFKTYTPPSTDPKPFKVHAFASSNHKVTVRLSPPVRRILSILHGKKAQLSIVTTPVLPLPQIGFERTADLKQNFAADFGFYHINHPDKIAGAQEWLMNATGALHIGIKPGALGDQEMDAIAACLAPVATRISLWQMEMESTARDTGVQMARFQKFAEKLQSRALVAVGTPFDFMDFNRGASPVKNGSLPWFGYKPTVHASDAATVMENLGTFEWLRKSAGNFSPGEVALGPVKLPISAPDDLRAAWLVGFLSNVFKTPGFHSVCLAPEDFDTPSISKIFEMMAGHKKVLPTISDHPLQTLGFTLLNAKNQKRVFIANLLGTTQPIKLKSGVCKATITRITKAELETTSGQGVVETQEAAGAKLEFSLASWEVIVIDMAE